jgi:hypothetical protein
VSESKPKIMNVMREKHESINKVRHQSQKNLTLLQKKKIDEKPLNEAQNVVI